MDMEKEEEEQEEIMRVGRQNEMGGQEARTIEEKQRGSGYSVSLV